MNAQSAAETVEEEAHRPAILVVEDSPLDQWRAVRLIERHLGWRVSCAANGREALALLATSSPDLILTDVFMPEVDGLELIEALRRRGSSIPVVLMTGQGNEELALRALRAGAASYLAKKDLTEDLAATLDQVLAAVRLGRRRQRLMSCMTQTESSFVLENDRSLVPPLVALLQDMLAGMRLVDERERLRVSVALEEALTNALYHGNLGIGSELKQNDDSSFARLAEERGRQAPYRDRRIHVTARITSEEATISIRDEGDGFDLAALPDPTDPANLERRSGRGLLLIRTFMDEVRYNPVGNQITMVKRRRG